MSDQVLNFKTISSRVSTTHPHSYLFVAGGEIQSIAWAGEINHWITSHPPVGCNLIPLDQSCLSPTSFLMYRCGWVGKSETATPLEPKWHGVAAHSHPPSITHQLSCMKIPQATFSFHDNFKSCFHHPPTLISFCSGW